MKVKMQYFYQMFKTRIILGISIFCFALMTILVYKAFFENKNSVEVIYTENEVKEEKKNERKEVGVYVDIKGEVRSPGVYFMESGKRIIDVIQEAGGLTKYADTSVNNLSRKVNDEMVIIIYSETEVASFDKTKELENQILEEAMKFEESLENNALLKKEDIDTSSQVKVEPSSNQKNGESEENVEDKISINTASEEELMQLSGIGQAKAKAIITYRNQKGTFQSIEEIINVNGIGNAIFEKIKDHIKI